MSEPSSLCFSVAMPPSSFEAWLMADLVPPGHWNDWEIVGARARDFALWQRVGGVRVGSLLPAFAGQGTTTAPSQGGRIERVALLAAKAWPEQLMLLGAVRMLEGFGAVGGWALMRDYVFERSGTAWAMRFPDVGRAVLMEEAPADIRSEADALVLPILEALRQEAAD